MDNNSYGMIDSRKIYTCAYLAPHFFGLSKAKTREILRDNFECVEIGNGTLAITGGNLMAGIERMAQSPRVVDEETGATPDRLSRRQYPSSNGNGAAKPTRRRGTKA